MLNKDLYERYLQKKAKKLGVSVDELRGKSTPAPAEPVQEPVSEQQTVSQPTYEQPQPVYEQPQQTTYQQPAYQQPQPTYQTYQQPQTAYQQPTPQPSSSETPVFTPSRTNFEPKADPVCMPEDKRENKFALIGYPLGHSLSKVIHTAGFKSLQSDAVYDVLETPPESLVERIKMLKNSNYKGFNVTIPLKLPVALFVDEVDKYADIASAINTVVINPDRTLKGYNTDVIGFKNAIPVDINLTGKVAGILGTGGASRAATVALADSGVKEIRFYTRNIPNSLQLLNYMRRVFPNVTFDAYQIENIRDLSMVDILVNTTPIGMQGYSADLTPVERPQLMTLPKNALVYDVIYNPRKTILLKLAEELCYRTVNGVEMLLNQAVAAERIWLGQNPDLNSMRLAMYDAM